MHDILPTAHRNRKRSRRERAQETRAALLQAAFRVVARHGYGEASVSRITEAAGVAQGTLYSYFESHQKLLEELLPAEGTQMLDFLADRVRASRNYFEQEEIGFSAFFDYLAKRPYFLRVLTEAETSAPASYAQHMANIERRYLNSLRRAQAAGEIRPQADRAFRAISEVLAGARGHIAIGFQGGRQAGGRRLIPDWAPSAYVKFIRNGLDARGELMAVKRPRRRATAEDRSTRALLLASAARSIHRSGYAGATVASITEDAGVAIGTFYTHFRSRQQLFEELLTQVRSRMLADVREAVRGSKSFLEMEYRGFLAFFDHLHQNPWYIRIESEASVWTPKPYRRHFDDLAGRYLTALRRSHAKGELANYRGHELTVLAYIFMAARHYLATRYVLQPGGSPRRLPSWVARVYGELLQRGLSADPGRYAKG